MDILKWCGFEYDKKSEGYTLPDGRYIPFAPPLDMNFFFQYVEKELKGYSISKPTYTGVVIVLLYIGDNVFEGVNPDFNEAWQSALLKLIGD